MGVDLRGGDEGVGVSGETLSSGRRRWAAARRRGRTGATTTPASADSTPPGSTAPQAPTSRGSTGQALFCARRQNRQPGQPQRAADIRSPCNALGCQAYGAQPSERKRSSALDDRRPSRYSDLLQNATDQAKQLGGIRGVVLYLSRRRRDPSTSPLMDRSQRRSGPHGGGSGTPTGRMMSCRRCRSGRRPADHEDPGPSEHLGRIPYPGRTRMPAHSVADLEMAGVVGSLRYLCLRSCRESNRGTIYGQGFWACY